MTAETTAATGGAYAPGDAWEALAMAEAALDYLYSPGAGEVDAAALGGILESLAGISAKHSAARMRLLARFDADNGHDADGYQSTGSWLAGKTKTPLPQARGEAAQARRMNQRPQLLDAVADERLSPAWAAAIERWTRGLPDDLKAWADELLTEAAQHTNDLADIRMLAVTIEESWRRENSPVNGEGDGDGSNEPDDGFEDRGVKLGITFDGAGRLNGDLTPECAAAVAAIFESLGKRRGREDTRTQGQRFHDALKEASELLIRARMVPDRAGADTHVDVHVALADLMQMDGASALTEIWLKSKAGEHGYLTGDDARAVACDALIVPVVTAAPDWDVIDDIVTVVLDLYQHPAIRGDSRTEAKPVPPQAWQALQYAIARLAITFVSGPGALASVLRTGLLPAPFNTRSVPIDVGHSDHIPEAVRRAVILRDGHCAWAGGCDRRPAQCDVHHIRHKKDGGPTSVTQCQLYCDFHHDICIHRWGWKVELLPDGSTTATSPDGQHVLRSHPPPPGQVA
jgi:hypothetical protein